MKMTKGHGVLEGARKVSPMSGCWPMLIEFADFLALFRMIPNAIELRGQPFLWACDLSNFGHAHAHCRVSVEPAAAADGRDNVIQARMTPASPGVDPAQQAMMKYHAG